MLYCVIWVMLYCVMGNNYILCIVMDNGKVYCGYDKKLCNE